MQGSSALQGSWATFSAETLGLKSANLRHVSQFYSALKTSIFFIRDPLIFFNVLCAFQDQPEVEELQEVGEEVKNINLDEQEGTDKNESAVQKDETPGVQFKLTLKQNSTI